MRGARFDEVFGEENLHRVSCVAEMHRKNDAKFFSVGHEYMLVYAKITGLSEECQSCLARGKARRQRDAGMSTNAEAAPRNG